MTSTARTDGEDGVTVVIVDDHDVVALGLRALLDDEQGITVAGSARDVAGAVDLVERTAPDVVLMDFRLDGGSGIDATSRIRALPQPPSVVMITSAADRGVLARALEAGCTGFVSKQADRADLVGAVLAAARDEPYFTDDVRRHVAHLRRFDDPDLVDLSPREVEVLQLTADGLTPEEVASQLFLSVHTVRNHLRNAMHQLDAHTRLDAVVKAVRARLISIDG